MREIIAAVGSESAGVTAITDWLDVCYEDCLMIPQGPVFSDDRVLYGTCTVV
jgi:hypothetical protein